MKMRKLLALLMAMVFVVSMLSACGDTGKKDATSTPAETSDAGADNGENAGNDNKENVEITWMFWDDLKATEDLMTLEYAKTVERFNAADNGYTVKPVTTKLAEYPTMLNAKIGTAEMPDVFICDPGPNLNQYVSNNVAMDLTSILDEDSEWKNSFNSNLFKSLTYDGKIMAIPLNYVGACVFYNTEIFEECGVETPETWEDFIDVCQKIKDKGYSPITVSAGTNWCLGMIAGYLCDREGGPDNLDNVLANKGKFTDESYVNAANKLLELKEFFQPTYIGDDNNQAVANFYNGDAAMLVQGSWVIGQINGTAPEMEEKTGVFRFPDLGKADPNRWVVKTDNLVVNKDTKKLDACIAFLKMFTDEEAQKNTAEIAGKMPVTNVEVDFEKAPKELKYVKDGMESMTGTLGFYNEMLPTTEAGDTFNNTMVSIVMGDKTPEAGLEELQKYMEENVYE